MRHSAVNLLVAWARHQQNSSAIYDRSNLLSWQKWYCGRDTPRDCYSHNVRVVYRTVHLDWKLQNNREKRSISRTKPFHRILIIGNLENLAKNRQVGIICHINVKRKQETGNRQTDKLSTVTLVRMRRALIKPLSFHRVMKIGTRMSEHFHGV